MTLEKDIETPFVAWCHSKKGVRCRKLKLETEQGFPDRTVFLPTGKTLYVEFKKPGEKASFHQYRWNKFLNDNGFPAIITDDLNEAKTFVESWL